jgi:single-strand DNA-binding protein
MILTLLSKHKKFYTMNTLTNNVQLIGNLGKDVEVVTFNSGNKKASVPLATTEFYKNDKGELIKNTQWHNLIVWGKNAELISKSATKGCKIAVQGMVNYRTYLDKAGITQKVTEILVSEFMKIAEPTALSSSNITDPRPF